MSSTIITAYYQIPSKTTHSNYLLWIDYFLRNIENNIVFFTSEDLVEYFRAIRNTNIIYKILPFKELSAIQKYGYDFWLKHKNLDPEKYHTPELGIIWYEKKDFVLKITEENPFNTEYFIWCDAGCMRNKSLFPKINSFGKNISLIDNDKLNVQFIGNLGKQYYSYPDITIAGAIITGDKSSWENYKKVYDEMLMEYDSKNISGISDQYITASCINKTPDIFNCIVPRSGYIYNDKWFFFLEELS